MGVSGLTAFIDDNQHLLTDFELHDTRLVIDGNNLYHFLYYYFHVRHEYGGDYDEFADSCTVFFDSLHCCNVTPCVVFDGAYDADGRKLRTSLKRAQERIHLAGFLSVGNRGKILPVLAYETFRNALNRMHIDCVTCDSEADQQIASLAVHWSCPVLSNDSDFFIFNMPAGVVLLDYLNIHVNSKSNACAEDADYNYMAVQIFYLNDLVRALNVKDVSLIALFASLLGNDVVDRRNFEPFFTKTKLPKGSSKFSSGQKKIASLLKWIKSRDNLAEATAMVISQIPRDKQENVRCLLSKSIDGYTKLVSSLHFHFENDINKHGDYVKNQIAGDSDITQATAQDTLIEIDVCSNSCQSLLKAKGSQPLPFWFLDGVHKGTFSVFILNAITLRRVILLSQVEIMHEQSSYCCSRLLRRYIYAILLSTDEDCRHDRDSLFVEEYDRERKTLKCNVVKPQWELKCGKIIPVLETIPTLDVQLRFEIIQDMLDAPIVLASSFQFPNEVQFLLSVAHYWIVNADPKIYFFHLQALIVCFFKLGVLDEWIIKSCSRQTEAPTETGKGESTDNSIDQQLHNSKHVLDKFCERPRRNNAISFDCSLVHAFAQFQTCLLAGFYANQLLLSPVVHFNPARFFNGTFLYNFTRELKSRKDPNLFIQELLGRSSSVAKCYLEIVDFIVSRLPADSFHSINATSKGTRSKKSRKQTRNTVLLDESQPDDANAAGAIESTCKYKCDLTNKFGCLTLADC